MVDPQHPKRSKKDDGPIIRVNANVGRTDLTSAVGRSLTNFNKITPENLQEFFNERTFTIQFDTSDIERSVLSIEKQFASLLRNMGNANGANDRTIKDPADEEPQDERAP